MKTIAIVSLLVMGLVAAGTPALAGTSRLGGEIGLGTANDNVDDGLALQGYLEFDVQEQFALRGGISYYAGDATVDILSDGEVTMFGIEASALYKIKAEKAKPYIGAGIGYYMPEHELSGDAETVLAMMGLRGEDDLDSGIGFFLMGGVSVPLSDAVSFVANAKYLILEVDDDAKVTNLYTFQSATNTGEVELNMLFLTAGLQIEF